MEKLIWTGIAVFIVGTVCRGVAAAGWYGLVRRRTLSPEQHDYYLRRYRRRRLIGLAIALAGVAIALIPTIVDRQIEAM